MKPNTILTISIILCSSMLSACGRIIPNTGGEEIPPTEIVTAIAGEQNLVINPTETVVAVQSTDAPEGPACLTPTASIKNSNVYLREGPDVRYQGTSRYQKDDKFKLLGHRQDWFQAEAADGNQGWLYKDWLTLPSGLDIDAVCSASVDDLPPIPGPLQATPEDEENDCGTEYYPCD